MTEVVIDGVRYIPASEVSVEVDTVLYALARQYHTEDSIRPNWRQTCRVVVAEREEWDQDGEGSRGESLEAFAVRLVAALRNV